VPANAHTHDEEARRAAMRVQGEIVIEKPIEDVFDYVADERNEPSYNRHMSRADKVSPGPIGVGTTFHSVMTRAGRRADMTVTFTEFDRPRHIAERTALANMDITGELLFDTVPEGTRMRWSWDLEPHGVYRLLGPLIRLMGKRQERSVWNGCKQLLERPPAPATTRS
jgi:hypothetical protein